MKFNSSIGYSLHSYCLVVHLKFVLVFVHTFMVVVYSVCSISWIYGEEKTS